MKVYVLLFREWGDTHINAITSTRAKAEELLAQVNALYRHNWAIKEYEVME